MGIKFKIGSLTAFATTLIFIFLSLFVKALSIKYNDFFVKNVDFFLWGSPLAIFVIAVIFGISISTLKNQLNNKVKKELQ